VYLDSAIIVKLLVREAGSVWFNRTLQGHAFESSELALTEVRSAVLAKERAGHITARERKAAADRFLAMVEHDEFRLFAVSRQVLHRATAIQLACHPHIPLRTLDALHVATCDLHHSDACVTTDMRMRAACEQLGIALIPERPEDVKSG